MKVNPNPSPCYLSFDVSTTCIGIALFGHNGKLIQLTHIKLESDTEIEPENRYIEKAKLFKNYILNLKKYVQEIGGYVDKVFVEEPLGSSNNVNTAIMLARFNGIVCYIINEVYNVIPTLYSIHSIRKTFCPEFVVYKNGKNTLSFPKTIDKKEYIWEKVSKLEKNLQWLYNKKQKLCKENFDMSDAYACGFHGLKVNNVI
jgi:hypothetical protein